MELTASFDLEPHLRDTYAGTVPLPHNLFISSPFCVAAGGEIFSCAKCPLVFFVAARTQMSPIGLTTASLGDKRNEKRRTSTSMLGVTPIVPKTNQDPVLPADTLRWAEETWLL